ncbi:MAG: hypothetical protein EZS28_019799 [Streblomastix strix]|uniref:Uncharacterized protein n=1 Tax=Streblomastix strix TaxID=222440 RepID=A0A5J4VPV3_9EUKA|nr:MAG: hypothetical protein EZS28_019799 [Streblomastix strix]
MHLNSQLVKVPNPTEVTNYVRWRRTSSKKTTTRIPSSLIPVRVSNKFLWKINEDVFRPNGIPRQAQVFPLN